MLGPIALGGCLFFRQAERVSLKLCPDYDTRFVRDRPLWWFVAIFAFHALSYLLVSLYGLSLVPQFYTEEELKLFGSTVYLMYGLVLGFNLFNFLLVWLLLQPWKLTWHVINVIFCVMLLAGGVAFMTLLQSPEQRELFQLNSGIRVEEPEGWLDLLLGFLFWMSFIITFLWWWRRRVMYGVTWWLPKNQQPEAATG